MVRRAPGLALAVVLTGSGTGSIVLTIIAQHVMAAHGWRVSYVVLGAIALLVRNRPAAVVAKQPEPAVRIGKVLRSSIFWLIAVPVMLGALSLNATIAHLSALLTDHSISPSGAVFALSMLGISGIIGRLITGDPLDRMFAPLVSLAVLLISGLGIVVTAYATTTSGGIVGAFLMGFGAGSEADVVPYWIAKYFGRGRFSTLYGLSWTAYAVGGATGPVLMGHAFDKAGSYEPATVLLFAAPLLVAAALQLLLPKYRAVALEGEASSILEVAIESASQIIKNSFY